jgi:membrane protease YdiL (CAAX protease family)
VRAVFKIVLVFLLWNIAAGFFLLFVGPLAGLPAALALSAALLWVYLLRPGTGETRPQRWALLRLRPLRGEALLWTLVAVPVLLVFSWALGDVYTRLVPVPVESLNPFEPILRTPSGRFAIAVFAVAVAPMIEEFIFRGMIQRKLERRFGSVPGVLGGAALFAAVHMLPWVFPLHFVLGIAFGVAVYATRSIWAGVLLHASNNSAAMVATALDPGEEWSTGGVWETGLTADLGTSLLILLLSSAAAFWTARKLLSVGRISRVAP